MEIFIAGEAFFQRKLYQHRNIKITTLHNDKTKSPFQSRIDFSAKYVVYVSYSASVTPNITSVAYFLSREPSEGCKVYQDQK